MTTLRIGTRQTTGNTVNQPNANSGMPVQQTPRPMPPGTPVLPSTPKMVIGVGANLTRKIVVPFAPQTVDYDGITLNWQTVQRDGNRKPLLIAAGRQLETISMRLLFAFPGQSLVSSNIMQYGSISQGSWEIPVTEQLKALKALSRSKQHVGIQWSKFEYGDYRVTALSIQSQSRHPQTNEITNAVVDITFTEASDAKANKGPASGGVKNDHDGDGKGGGPKGHPAHYKVQKGDTLMSIGMKFYKDHRAWRKIAKANKIKHPKKDKKLKPGRKLKLP